MKRVQTRKRRLWTHWALQLMAYFAAMVVIHEPGHIATLRFVRTAHIRVSIWPGYELYPLPGETFAESGRGGV